MVGRFRGLSSPQITRPIVLLKIIKGLFPHQERDMDSFQQTPNVAAIPHVTRDELLEIYGGISNSKALKLGVKSKLDIFAEFGV